MKNTELKFFIDTTVTVSALTGRNKDAWILLESGKKRLISLFVNEFVIKEIRRALIEFDFTPEQINYAVDYVNNAFITYNPSAVAIVISNFISTDNTIVNCYVCLVT